MLLPTRRWLVVACLLALVALAGYSWQPALALLLLLDVAWVGLLLWDGWQARRVPLTVEREAPPAFSVGRTLPVWYRWSASLRRPQQLQIRELMPLALGGANLPTRTVRLLPGVTRERLDLTPVARGRGAGGVLSLRRRGPLGLAWRQERTMLPWEPTVFP
ncbi:MAG TPA: hypothetical protein VFS74_02600, partial [Gemmatimonadales bacterium]|nr:hypothetical protein [Gemmatimonadales bacterium]